ncbi:MAG: branched-chain amino acid aminotransferase [Planctomycetes bacterium]|nr:branched-chain amino acid aminotransferase [Planctomycetota bacterium]
MPEPVVYLNGKFIPASKASIAIYDAGIVLGATVTDFTRTFHHKPFRLEDHVHRLYRSMKYCRFHVETTPEEMIELTLKLNRKNTALLKSHEELGIIHFVTAGIFQVYAGSAGSGEEMTPTVCIHSFPLPFYIWKGAYRKGVHLVTPSNRHVPPQCIDPKMKYRSRLHYWLADQETHLVDPKGVSLLLDLDGNVTETGGANFLMVKDGVIKSPTTRNILPGVSRQTVIELAGEMGIPFVEQDLQVHDVCNADEAFLATSPVCLMPATKINGMTIGSGKPGPIYKKLMKAWSKLVGLDIVAQIKASKPPKSKRK